LLHLMSCRYNGPVNLTPFVYPFQQGTDHAKTLQATQEEDRESRLLVRTTHHPATAAVLTFFSKGSFMVHRFVFFDLAEGWPAHFATNSESSPPWKKIMPCSSAPFTTAQPRPCAGSIAALPSHVHSTFFRACF